ncbi:MAG: TSUP family transporter [Phycisphaeraceae bacterium]
MDLTPYQLFVIVGVVLFAALVQAAVGFGAGMIIVPVLIWAGLPIEHALAVMSAAVCGQLTVKLWRYRREVPWREVVWPMGTARLIGYVPGFVLLWLLAGASTAVVKQAVGATVLLALAMQAGLRVEPRERLATGWAWLAGIAGGATAGAVGMGGPPLVLWVVAHDWPGKQARLFLWASFWATMPLQLGVLIILFHPIEQAVLMGVGLATLPAALLGTAGGLWVGHRIPRRQLRWMMIGLLVVLGVGSLIGPMLSPG